MLVTLPIHVKTHTSSGKKKKYLADGQEILTNSENITKDNKGRKYKWHLYLLVTIPISLWKTVFQISVPNILKNFILRSSKLIKANGYIMKFLSQAYWFMFQKPETKYIQFV
eukprot:gnl/Chilomastix_cuspidata/7359.p4 GENE.gnl/Chilomastix_cuspidata/7359~~gnl/Chilomastix_cuspidata/7359.p4  ORF type:complete len:112 (+),score=3.84 gnl/Chilomastix_cuspidata/7359:1396-1731(+)